MSARHPLLAVVLLGLTACQATAQAPVRITCAGGPTSRVVLDSTRLMSDLSALAADSMEGRAMGTAGGARARQMLVARMAAIGLDTLPSGRLQPFTAPGGHADGANVIGVVPGRSAGGRVILLTAHYDHLGVRNGAIYNGADDNASGTAALLAIGTWLRAHPPEHTVVLVAFDGEEEGLLGAAAFVASGLVPADSMLIDLNMDMVSRSERRELFAVGPARYPALRPYLARAACSAGVNLMLGHDKGASGSEDWTMQSDQGAFEARGVPFIYFGVEDHPDYHKPSDDVARIDPGFFLGAAESVAQVLVQVDANPAAALAARKAK